MLILWVYEILLVSEEVVFVAAYFCVLQWTLWRVARVAGVKVLPTQVAVFWEGRQARLMTSLWCLGLEQAWGLSVGFLVGTASLLQAPVTVSGRLDINRLLKIERTSQRIGHKV